MRSVMWPTCAGYWPEGRFFEHCDRQATEDSDLCAEHLRHYEADQAADGHFDAPCANGHFGCAHEDRGACHSEMFGRHRICQNPMCSQHEPDYWAEDGGA